MDASILIIEDEQDLLELLRYNLEREGYQISTAATGEAGLKSAQNSAPDAPDLILLDLMLPGMDGLEVCRFLKKRESTASIQVIMLTARGEESDIVQGLEFGADDYVTKPFSPRVLLARIQAVLRRRDSEAGMSQNNPIIRVGSVTIDQERYEATVRGKPVRLTASEFKMLRLLTSKSGRVFTRQQIIDAVHGELTAVTDRSVDVLVMGLRKKLGDAGDGIETVRGVGYKFRD